MFWIQPYTSLEVGQSMFKWFSHTSFVQFQCGVPFGITSRYALQTNARMINLCGIYCCYIWCLWFYQVSCSSWNILLCVARPCSFFKWHTLIMSKKQRLMLHRCQKLLITGFKRRTRPLEARKNYRWSKNKNLKLQMVTYNLYHDISLSYQNH